jgi:flavin reductase (DIM6/NTAB) family NADH-FMN oxidoreductase RutF
VVAAHPAGDHVIYIGEVEALRVDASRQPLLHQAGIYGHFTG